ncbi:hypothetical protein AGDE_10422 [Angomonas deanei]|uniref:Phosphoribulokinase / Uridine kinase family n=1 Tax=Angomonas deanei TaxID=59799 RepID=A0A7G2CM42_9TRYP|nr:hypothetical protein AGDE_10422 [Angomonas deanei]CAD2219332.1 hypothetical protein, conserved [Angomonas deanei]|eukprot:EPY28357.1 hypothetical protein AGDE_10422 [Angomonas deanei]
MSGPPMRRRRNPKCLVCCPPRVVVGIAGRPGSGKSTAVAVIADRVRERMRHYQVQACLPPQCGTAEGLGKGVEVQVMPMDGYHLYRRELKAMPDPKRAFERRGAEWTFNPGRLRDDLTAIKYASTRVRKTIVDQSGTRREVQVLVRPAVSVPSFDHAAGDPLESAITIQPKTGIVLVEGNYLLYQEKPTWAAVSGLFDLRVFLQCPREVCLERLIRRHCKAWGITREEAAVRAGGSDMKNGDLVETTSVNAQFLLHSINVDSLDEKKEEHGAQKKTTSKL